MKAPCVRVPRSDGERTRRQLVDAGLIDRTYEIASEDGWVFIPVTDPAAVPADLTVIEKTVSTRSTQVMPEDLLAFTPTYERLGDIVLLDEPDQARAEQAGAAFMRSDLPVKTVVNKASAISGDERVREWDVIAGDGTETVHREYGYAFALDIASVYFSPRLATERRRVTSQVTPGERVMDMFAGVGPFSIPMADRGATVVAVDVNEHAIQYLRSNIDRNDVEDHIRVIEGDVRELASEYSGWADRIVMNLPHSAHEFLETAVSIAGSECLIHYYDIQEESDPFGPGERAFQSVAGDEYTVHIEARRVVRSYAPHLANVCLDVRLRQ